MNGSGKTTFIKLLCRLYDPTEGVILLNGIDIRNYNYHEYMQLFSVVFQDFRLFSFELGQNVAGSMNYDCDKAAQCLRDAGFGIRLDKLPKGLATALYKDFDEKGVDISGGEAQKIAELYIKMRHLSYLMSLRQRLIQSRNSKYTAG